MKMKPQTLFGAIAYDSKAPWVPAYTVHHYAKDVREAIGKAWDPEDPKRGWKAARLEGMRVVKLKVQLA